MPFSLRIVSTRSEVPKASCNRNIGHFEAVLKTGWAFSPLAVGGRFWETLSFLSLALTSSRLRKKVALDSLPKTVPQSTAQLQNDRYHHAFLLNLPQVMIYNSKLMCLA